METFITCTLTHLVPLINACSLDGKKSKEVKSIILSAKKEGKSCEPVREKKHIISCHQWSESMENVGEWLIGHVIRDIYAGSTYYKYNIYNTHTHTTLFTHGSALWMCNMHEKQSTVCAAPPNLHHTPHAFADWYYCCLLAHIKLRTDKAMKKQ